MHQNERLLYVSCETLNLEQLKITLIVSYETIRAAIFLYKRKTVKTKTVFLFIENIAENNQAVI